MKRYLEVRSLKEDLKRFEERHSKSYNPYDYGDLPPEAFGNNIGIDDGGAGEYVRAIRDNGETFAGSTTGPDTPGSGIMPPPSAEFNRKADRVQALMKRFRQNERNYRTRRANGQVTPEEKAAHDKLMLALHRNSKAAMRRGEVK